MKPTEIKSEAKDEFSEEKEVLLKKLTTIFDPDTAIDFVCPKTHDTKQHVTIEDLTVFNYEHPEERLQRLRSMEHYQTTTQSLSRNDLEASYKAFIRGQVGQQQCSRDDLEKFVRNNTDIDDAERYLDFGHDSKTNPLQSHLLFYSSKLNEQRATILRSAGYNKTLRQLNDNLSLQKYFTNSLEDDFQYPYKERGFADDKQSLPRPQSMHVEHKEKKFHIKFLKDSNDLQYLPKILHRSKNHRNLYVAPQKNIEALLDGENSTVNALSTTSNTSNIHREIFPALSLAALKEYRPTLTAKPTVTTESAKQRTRRPYQQTHFNWEKSIVSQKTE